MSNKTLRREYSIAGKEVQEQYHSIFNGGKTEDIRNALAHIDKLPILNKKAVWVKNRQGRMIAIVGKKGSLKTFSTDYFKKNWYFDGNKVGKRKQLLAKAFNDDSLLELINTDGLDGVWKKIAKRVQL